MNPACANAEAEVEGWGLVQHVALMCACSRMQHSAGVQGAVVEIGTYMGSTFIPLVACKRPEERALAIDPFEDALPEGIPYAAGSRSVLEANLRQRCAHQANIEIWQASSDDVTASDVSARAGEPVRLFHVDGSRAAKSVRHGLHLAESVLASGGCVFLDDFVNEGWPTVSEGAFAHFAGGSKLVPFALVKCKLGLCFAPLREAFCAASRQAMAGMELVQVKTVSLFRYEFPMGR